MGKYRRDRQSVELKSFLSGYDAPVREIALRLRSLVLALVPEVLELIDPTAKLVGYGFTPAYKDMVCVIIPQRNYVNLGFPRGVELHDPTGLLTGTGIRARHVKINNLTEADNPAIRDLLTGSIEITRADKEGS